MIQRFVSATAIAAMAIAVGAVALWALAHTYSLNNPYLLAEIWCVVPLGWGIWAMLAPKSWVPVRLPEWGAILGLLAGTMAAFVVKVPDRIFAQAASFRMRAVLVLVAVAIYYLLWMAVRAVYRWLMPEPAKQTVYKEAA
jgi:hypothetical protein